MLPANNRHYTAVFQHPDSNPPIRVEGNFILLEFIIVSMWFGNDFVNSIKVSLDELENTGRQGYIEGISSIILNKLKNLSHYDRPIHCADQKREVLYIKNDNQWIKETEEKPILTKAIKTIANENIKQIKTWRDKNPECTNSDSKKNSLYLKIVSNSMSGTDKNECDKNINKIISNVAKEVIIDK